MNAWVRIIGASLSLCTVLLACKQPTAPPDRRESSPPSWYQNLKNLKGVNLPHLPGEIAQDYIQHTRFKKNWVDLQWNVARLPISWSNFSGSGQSIIQMQNSIEALILKLKEIHVEQGAQSPILLMLDFHQYRFGPVCGGDGVPSGIINETGLVASDINCPFLAWERFWNNDHDVQTRWATFALQLLSRAPDWVRANQDWLTIAIEPMNEPFAGSGEAMFVSDSLTTISKVSAYMDSGQNTQVTSKLIPFYKKFAAKISEMPDFKTVADRGLFVFDPFFLDLSEFTLPLTPPVTLKGDSDYSSAVSLRTIAGTPHTIRWIAGPHHYNGAYDQAFRDFFPAAIRPALDSYPNVIFDAAKTAARFKRMKDRMIAGGMDSLLGEYGTYTRMTGYAKWVEDTQNSFKTNGFMGHAWWRYYPDPNSDQAGYYLLTGDWNLQQLKCGSPGSIVQVVYQRCSTD